MADPQLVKRTAPTLDQIIQGVAGVFASDQKDLALSLSRLLRNVRGEQFSKVLREEWEDLRSKGKIKEDYTRTDQGFSCLHEVLDSIETDGLDEKRFKAIKALFFSIAQEGISNREQLLPSTMLKLLRRLDTAELVVLFTAYRCYKMNKLEYNNVTAAAHWLHIVAQESGLNYSAAVENTEEKLIGFHLLGHRVHPDRSGIAENKTFRLTGLAIKLCEFIVEQDPELIFGKA